MKLGVPIPNGRPPSARRLCKMQVASMSRPTRSVGRQGEVETKAGVWKNSTAFFEMLDHEQEVVDRDPAVVGSGAAAVVQVGIGWNLHEEFKEIEQVIDRDPAVAGPGAGAVVSRQGSPGRPGG